MTLKDMLELNSLQPLSTNVPHPIDKTLYDVLSGMPPFNVVTEMTKSPFKPIFSGRKKGCTQVNTTPPCELSFHNFCFLGF